MNYMDVGGNAVDRRSARRADNRSPRSRQGGTGYGAPTMQDVINKRPQSRAFSPSRLANGASVRQGSPISRQSVRDPNQDMLNRIMSR